jgi:hypothetical protein
VRRLPAFQIHLEGAAGSQNDPKSFLDYAQEALLERPVSRALKFIAGLAIANGLIEALLRLYPRSREDALAIAQKAIACDPRFDYTLLEILQRPIPAQLGETAFHVGLDILDAISPGDRLVPDGWSPVLAPKILAGGQNHY